MRNGPLSDFLFINDLDFPAEDDVPRTMDVEHAEGVLNLCGIVDALIQISSDEGEYDVACPVPFCRSLSPVSSDEEEEEQDKDSEESADEDEDFHRFQPPDVWRGWCQGEPPVEAGELVMQPPAPFLQRPAGTSLVFLFLQRIFKEVLEPAVAPAPAPALSSPALTGSTKRSLEEDDGEEHCFKRLRLAQPEERTEDLAFSCLQKIFKEVLEPAVAPAPALSSPALTGSTKRSLEEDDREEPCFKRRRFAQAEESADYPSPSTSAETSSGYTHYFHHHHLDSEDSN